MMEYVVCRCKMRTLGDVSNARLNHIFKPIQEAQPLKDGTISASEVQDNESKLDDSLPADPGIQSCCLLRFGTGPVLHQM